MRSAVRRRIMSLNHADNESGTIVLSPMKVADIAVLTSDAASLKGT